MQTTFPQKDFFYRLKDGSTPFIAWSYLLCLIYAVVIIVPMYYVFVSAFKNNLEIYSAPLALPHVLNFVNFAKAQLISVFDRAALITIGVTAGAELITLILSFPAAYGIARIRTRLAVWAELIFSLGFLIPALAMLLPVFMSVVRLGLLNNPVSLILFYPATKLSVSVILLASYLRTVPHEVEESAQMDGANRLQLIWHIFIPLARPGIITVVVLNFIDFWNEFLFALVLLNTKNRTLQIALTALRTSNHTADFGVIAAGVAMAVIPVIIVFIVFQEQIVKGIYAGALKG